MFSRDMIVVHVSIGFHDSVRAVLACGRCVRDREGGSGMVFLLHVYCKLMGPKKR